MLGLFCKYIKFNNHYSHYPYTRFYSIPKSIRKTIWYDYKSIPEPQILCPCCKITSITPFCFEAGHIKSRKNNGSDKASNLLPICRTCNASMGSMDWDDYIHKFYGNERLMKDLQELPKLLEAIQKKN